MAEGLIGNMYESAVTDAKQRPGQPRWERLKKSKDEMSSVESQVIWR